MSDWKQKIERSRKMGTSYSALVKELLDEAKRQREWANEGESVVVGLGPDLMDEAARIIDKLREVE